MVATIRAQHAAHVSSLLDRRGRVESGVALFLRDFGLDQVVVELSNLTDIGRAVGRRGS